MAWAIWGALAWEVPLSAEAARLVDGMDDDVVALLALHASKLGLFPKNSLSKKSWAALVSQPNALEGEHGLLAYEANHQGWLHSPAVRRRILPFLQCLPPELAFMIEKEQATVPNGGEGPTRWESLGRLRVVPVLSKPECPGPKGRQAGRGSHSKEETLSK